MLSFQSELKDNPVKLQQVRNKSNNTRLGFLSSTSTQAKNIDLFTPTAGFPLPRSSPKVVAEQLNNLYMQKEKKSKQLLTDNAKKRWSVTEYVQQKETID